MVKEKALIDVAPQHDNISFCTMLSKAGMQVTLA